MNHYDDNDDDDHHHLNLYYYYPNSLDYSTCAMDLRSTDPTVANIYVSINACCGVPSAPQVRLTYGLVFI